MAENLLIGICGKIGSGKDTVADHLVAVHGFSSIPFARELKRTCVDVLRVDPAHLFGTQGEKAAPIGKLGVVRPRFAAFGDPWPGRVGKPWTGRWVAEFVGTDCFRAIYSRTWVDLALAAIVRDRGAGRQRHVVPDVRFPNEVEAIRGAGGVAWRVVRLGHRSERTGHASDELLARLEVDADLVARDGDVAGLLKLADEALADLEGRG